MGEKLNSKYYDRLELDDRPKGVWKYVVIIILLSSIIIIPYTWILINAFQGRDGSFTLSNWSFLWQKTELKKNQFLEPAYKPLLSSLFFATSMSVGVIVITVPAAYAMSRTKFFGRKFMARMLVVLDAFPSVALLISFIVLLSKMHLVNKLIGVIFVKVAMYLPGAIWLMKGFFDYINWDMEWAAIVDGASRFKTFLRVIVPAAKPGIAVILVNSFLSGWGEYILINLFMRGKSTAMSNFIGSMMDSEDGRYLVSSGVLAAACFCYIIPVIIGFIFTQKTLLQVKQGGSKQ